MAAPQHARPRTPGRVAIKVVAGAIGAVAPSTWAVLDAVDAVGSLILLFVAGYGIARSWCGPSGGCSGASGGS